MSKLQDIRNLIQEHAVSVSSSPEDWMDYMDTASRLYRYSFSDQLLIHAQRPDATACASLELWNEKMLRWVNRGARGIALFDETWQNTKLRYVFDISDTHMVAGGRSPYLWKMQEHQREEILTHLAEVYALEEKDAATLQDALMAVAREMVNDNLEEYLDGLEYAVEGTYLEDLDEVTIRSDFRQLATDSVYYLLSRRCGLDPMELLEEEDFMHITDYNRLSVLTFLGNTASQLSESILIDIGKTVHKISLEEARKEVENSNERNYNNFTTLMRETKNRDAETKKEENIENEGGTDYGTDISSQGRLPVSESDRRRGRSDDREIWDAAEDISERTQEQPLSEPVPDREAEQPSGTDRESSTGENGQPDGEITGEESGTGQGSRSDGMDSTHERTDGNSGREHLDGIGIQLVEDTREDGLSKAEEEIASALSLPEYPTADEQRRQIEKRAAALYAGEIPIPEEVVDEILRTGGNRKASQLRIIYNFMSEQTPEEYTEFVKREYRKGGKGFQIDGNEYSVWFDETGMQIAVGHTVTDHILDNPQRAEQVLVETENEIFGYDGIFGITETEWEVQKEREVSATKQEALERQSAEKIDETLLLHGESRRFAIYQMDSGDEHTYQFMGMESAKNLGYTIDGKDYRMVYAAPWMPTITLDNIFERFNIDRPEDFRGHSLSVSDVIVINRGAEITAYYVDSFGFQELPEFVQQRMNMLEHNSVRAYPPVYKETLEQAMGERDVDAYLDSRKLNLDCKKAIEDVIRENFDGLHLKQGAAKEVVERFGEERMNFVMANTIRELSHDGRFSRQNKDWAEHIEIPENISRGRNLNLDYVIESHPAVLDGFIDMARAEIRMQRIEQAIGENEVTITAETRGYEAEGHNGTWHTVDKKEYAGEKFFLMEHDEFGSDVAGIIVAENGQLVAEDLWNGFDEGALETVSEYLQENGTTLYDLTEFPKDSVVTLRSGQTLTIEEIQAVQKDIWEETMAGKNELGTDVRFNFHAVSEVQLPEGIKLKMPEIHYIDNFYVMEDVNAEGVVKVNRYESLDEAMQEYLRLPNHQKKVLGIQNTETMQESMDFIRCENGIDRLTHAYEQIGGWLNPEIYEAVNKMENMLDWNEVQIAYQIGKQYFTIQTAEDGYDYTFYNEDYQEDDGGIYDNPTIYVDKAASDILEDKGYSLEDAKVVDYEDLMADVEEVQEEQMQRIQLEKNCPASIFEGFRREEALQTYEGIAMQFTRSKGYLTIQATEEGYSFIFYDFDLHEIQSGDYDNPDAFIQEAAYEILKSERMDDMECVKVDYKEFEEMTIQHSKDLLQEGELRVTSEIGRNELALNSLSRAEVERGVLYHAQAVLEDMGMEQEVELLAARVYGSRSRQDLYREDSDLDVVISYRGNIREDSFFNELNAHGIAMAGIKVDINPIAEERITLAEYMKEADAYLDQQEIKKLAVDLDNFSYEYDAYEYKDTVENREEQVEKITEDILNKKTECLKDWLVEVSEESDIDSDAITAHSLLSRLEDAERFSIFDKQPEQEQPEATISFYVAECMEFPVMGEYHNNLTLEEAIKIYESIPSERLHGIKGIGFDLQDGDEDYSGEYGLMSGDRIDRDLIDMIPHYKESPLVQKAINDMEKYLNEKHGKVQEAEQTVEVKQEVSETPVKKESVSVEPNQTQKKEPVKGEKGELKKSVLQSLKEFQARVKAQEQKEMATEKSKAHKNQCTYRQCGELGITLIKI